MGESLSHGIIAFFFPIAWAIILYPICKKFHFTWIKTIFVVLACSVIAMVLKEYFDPKVSVNDIVSDILGIFFGTAFLAALFVWGGKEMSKLAVGAFQIAGRVSLRDLMSVSLSMEERAVAFFEEASNRLTDERAKELCKTLAREEQEEIDELRSILEQWPKKSPERDFIMALEEKITAQGLYVKPLFTVATREEVLEYAIDMKKLTQDFYSSFKDYFPRYWKREKVRELVEHHKEREEQLKDVLRNLD
jgi:rubrerythrin